eukprot:TRINITY_DN2838_c0_g1_i1.p1 TRINITY_DN2838_c0_g1~~TRINITY_DN2838_c0_g1_i1.p1  ORF type:complete len:981 (+),score=230.55 TRINITY_DN2838_c0_g1_i1:64-3006(+)
MHGGQWALAPWCFWTAARVLLLAGFPAAALREPTLLWSHPTGWDTALTAAGAHLLVASSDGISSELLVLTVESGSPLWHDGTGSKGVTKPVAPPAQACVSAGDAPSSIRCFESAAPHSLEWVWVGATSCCLSGAAVSQDGAVLVVSDESDGVTGLWSRNGSQLWSRGGGSPSPPISARNRILVVWSGQLRALSSASGDVLWSSGDTYTTSLAPAYDEETDLVYAAIENTGKWAWDHPALVAVTAGLQSGRPGGGTQLWAVQIGGVAGPPAAVLLPDGRSGVCLVEKGDSPRVTMRSAADGKVLWSEVEGSWSTASACAAGRGAVYYSAARQASGHWETTLIARSAADGRALWDLSPKRSHSRASGAPRAPEVSPDRVIYWGANDGRVYAMTEVSETPTLTVSPTHRTITHTRSRTRTGGTPTRTPHTFTPTVGTPTRSRTWTRTKSASPTATATATRTADATVTGSGTATSAVTETASLSLIYPEASPFRCTPVCFAAVAAAGAVLAAALAVVCVRGRRARAAARSAAVGKLDGLQRYEVMRFLGSGSYGSVFLVARKTDGQQLALKQLCCNTARAQEKALRELQVVRSVQGHPHMLTVVDAFSTTASVLMSCEEVERDSGSGSKTEPYTPREATLLSSEASPQARWELCIITPYYREGDLGKFIKNYGAVLPEEVILRFAGQIASLLQYLHARSPPLIHRDLKPENVLVSDDRRSVVVCDFGLARRLDATYCATRAGTFAFLAPECWRRHYAAPVDMWALGCIIYAAATRRVDSDTVRVMFFDAREPGFAEDIDRDLQGPGYGELLRAAVRRMLVVDPKARATAAEVCSLLGGPGVEPTRGAWGSISGLIRKSVIRARQGTGSSRSDEAVPVVADIGQESVLNVGLVECEPHTPPDMQAPPLPDWRPATASPKLASSFGPSTPRNAGRTSPPRRRQNAHSPPPQMGISGGQGGPPLAALQLSPTLQPLSVGTLDVPVAD